MQEPGHSGLSSGTAVVVACVVVVGGGVGLGFCLAGGATLVLSQQIDPLLQVCVCGISTEGLSQNAAIILRRQKPGHLGRLEG